MIGASAQHVINQAIKGENVGWGILIGLMILFVGFPLYLLGYYLYIKWGKYEKNKMGKALQA